MKKLTGKGVAIGIAVGLLIWVFMPESKASPEPQSAFIEFDVKTSDGITHHFDTTIPFSAMEAGYPNYECIVEFENQKYRIGFFANSYPVLPLPAVDIRYNFGENISGYGFAMPNKVFSAHSQGSSIVVNVYGSKFLDSLKQSYPNQFTDNLYCRTF